MVRWFYRTEVAYSLKNTGFILSPKRIAEKTVHCWQVACGCLRSKIASGFFIIPTDKGQVHVMPSFWVMDSQDMNPKAEGLNMNSNNAWARKFKVDNRKKGIGIRIDFRDLRVYVEKENYYLIWRKWPNTVQCLTFHLFHLFSYFCRTPWTSPLSEGKKEMKRLWKKLWKGILKVINL